MMDYRNYDFAMRYDGEMYEMDETPGHTGSPVTRKVYDYSNDIGTLSISLPNSDDKPRTSDIEIELTSEKIANQITFNGIELLDVDKPSTDGIKATVTNVLNFTPATFNIYDFGRCDGWEEIILHHLHAADKVVRKFFPGYCICISASQALWNESVEKLVDEVDNSDVPLEEIEAELEAYAKNTD